MVSTRYAKSLRRRLGFRYVLNTHCRNNMNDVFKLNIAAMRPINAGYYLTGIRFVLVCHKVRYDSTWRNEKFLTVYHCYTTECSCAHLGHAKCQQGTSKTNAKVKAKKVKAPTLKSNERYFQHSIDLTLNHSLPKLRNISEICTIQSYKHVHTTFQIFIFFATKNHGAMHRLLEPGTTGRTSSAPGHGSLFHGLN